MSACDKKFTSPIQPSFIPKPNDSEPPGVQSLIAKLGLQKHPEGGYFVETDRDTLLVPNPFQDAGQGSGDSDPTRHASTTIFYHLTPAHPMGVFHRNKGRTMHTLHKGRGRYVILHDAEAGQKARIETFLVGQNVLGGERLQWMVDGNKYKASFLLPDVEGGNVSHDGLLISEVILHYFL